MGYTHYFYTKPRLNQTAFFKVAKDFKKMVPIMNHLGVKLGDNFGDNTPQINSEIIAFNGLKKCGHQEHQIGLAWPSKNAKGVKPNHTFNELAELSKGNWFAGRELETRVCGGDCSYETFILEQQIEDKFLDRVKNGYRFDCTKTNYKPYDLAVNVCLVIAKHYLGNDIIVRSDGEMDNWIESMELCQHFLEYGQDFKLDEKSPSELAKEQPKPEITPTDKTKIKVGSVIYSSWGYDQTNIDYYKVKRISATGKTCKIVRIASKRIEETGFMSERVAPNPEIEICTEDYDEEKREYTKVKEVQAQIRTDSDGTKWLRCGNVGGGYLWIYESPMVATHYA